MYVAYAGNLICVITTRLQVSILQQLVIVSAKSASYFIAAHYFTEGTTETSGECIVEFIYVVCVCVTCVRTRARMHTSI